MILYVSNEYYGEGIPIPFPATAEEVRKKLDAGVQPLFIRGNGPVWHFEDRRDPAALYQETGVEKLNRLAGLVDAMDLDAQKVFAGALRAESVNGLDPSSPESCPVLPPTHRTAGGSSSCALPRSQIGRASCRERV